MRDRLAGSTEGQRCYWNRLRICLALALCSLWARAGEGQSVAQETTRWNKYVPVKLTADLSSLDNKQRQVLRLLIEAAEQMDAIFWLEASGDKDKVLSSIDDSQVRRFAEINYGPWDRLDNNNSFVDGVGEKPLGAQYYPTDLTKEEFEQYLAEHPTQREAMTSQYTLVRRGEAGQLIAVPYHEAFAQPTERATELLRQAASLAKEDSFKAYLLARASALLSDDYQHSDMLWMDMKDNHIDVVIGPIENYEDKLFGYKTAHECYVLIKDLQWSQRLAKFAEMLPALQRGLPVPDAYKQEEPGTDADLNAYDVVYYAGDCNAGSKTIAINLPNDEQVQLKKGSRRLQLKNAMRAKFDTILIPIADRIIVEDQRQHITFEAFFSNTMFHEVAHGLGVKYTIGADRQRVRDVLKETYSALEEGKADILGLYMVTQLFEQQQLNDGQLMDYYVTFMASIFRSVRFGAASAHGRANMIRFNYFAEQGAFRREANGRYRVNLEKMRQAMEGLSKRLLMLQGDGDYQAAKTFVEEMAFVPAQLQADLERLNRLGIPVDIVLEQGIDVLGL
ncbi:MAG: hypothetical protein R3E01_08860 [Pirellulaceae bacterium]|nr:hypothetical protein [Planctomycetales bacterium]